MKVFVVKEVSFSWKHDKSVHVTLETNAKPQVEPFSKKEGLLLEIKEFILSGTFKQLGTTKFVSIIYNLKINCQVI